MQRLEDCALERAIRGTETPIVSHGKIFGTWHKPDNALLRFLLQHHLPDRYGVQNLGPGHPVYDSIRAEAIARYEAENYDSEAEVLASLNAKLEAMRRNEAACEALMAQKEEDEAK